MSAAIASGAVLAQAPAELFTVSGVAYGSLHRRPPVNATVHIVGRDRAAQTDQRGQFRFDSVATGSYMFTLQHADIDSLGLPDIVARVNLSPTRSVVSLAIPSFASLWRGACGGTSVPTGTGSVYGAIRDAKTQTAIGNARVLLSWTDVGVGRDKKLKQTRLTFDTRTDSTGSYIACGIPVDVALEISASADTSWRDSTSITRLDLSARAARVQRPDIMVASIVVAQPVRSVGSDAVVTTSATTTSTTTTSATTPSATAAVATTASAATAAAPTLTQGSIAPAIGRTGIVSGQITNDAGAPLSGVRVFAEGVPEVRSDSAGAFALRGVPIGTRTIEFIAIGATPAARIVDVSTDRPTLISVKMERVTTLEKVEVKSRIVSSILRDFEDRKRMGFGYIQDSTQIKAYPLVSSIFRSFPSVRVGPGPREPSILLSGGCEANYFVNRSRVDKWFFYAYAVQDIAWVEVYPRRMTVPQEFMGGRECGVVVIFTKFAVNR